MIKVLVVDDSALMRKLLGQVLGEDGGFDVQFARNGVEALERAAAFDPDVVTLDVHMPEMDGLACLDRLMLERPRPVVMVSSLTAAGADATFEALRLGAVDFIAKPNGAMSLRMEELAPELVRKIRAAAGAKLKSTLRLKERIQHRIGVKTAAAVQPATPVVQRSTPGRIVAAKGDGLVLVGTSTGGPPALEALIVPLPASFPWPIVVAQHMPASFTGALARRLNGISAVEVVEIVRPVELRPGCVYIGRGDADVVVSRRGDILVGMAAPADRTYPWHPSADRLVRSAMEHLPASQLVGVLMTGMGNDGAEAMARLHEQGGRTIAEAEETAVVWGMPGELVKAGGASFVDPLPKIADRLRRLVPKCP